jgi:hypothetical protein
LTTRNTQDHAKTSQIWTSLENHQEEQKKEDSNHPHYHRIPSKIFNNDALYGNIAPKIPPVLEQRSIFENIVANDAIMLETQ